MTARQFIKFTKTLQNYSKEIITSASIKSCKIKEMLEIIWKRILFVLIVNWNTNKQQRTKIITRAK